MNTFDDRACALGEGPLWHPHRRQLFWFDIIGKRLLSVSDSKKLSWQFEEHVSAAGWIDEHSLLIASESQLFQFDLRTDTSTHVIALDADNPVTRSNDGRTDPWGGFWIGTMGKKTEAHAGAIYRFYKGELRTLFSDITVSNSICFAPGRSVAYYTDTFSRRIMRQPLAPADGWPAGAPEVFVDLRADALNPDGSVVDAEGCLWNAQWGAARIARYAPDGTFMSAINVPAQHSSCPAFGGDDLSTLFVTSAGEGLTGPHDGHTFAQATPFIGQAEHQVIL